MEYQGVEEISFSQSVIQASPSGRCGLPLPYPVASFGQVHPSSSSLLLRYQR